MTMQCPHCMKTDLHLEATKCHHCGGEVMSPEKAEKKAEEDAKGCMAGVVVLAVVLIVLFIAIFSVAAFGPRTPNVGHALGCIAVAFLAGGIALLIVYNKGSQD